MPEREVQAEVVDEPRKRPRKKSDNAGGISIDEVLGELQSMSASLEDLTAEKGIADTIIDELSRIADAHERIADILEALLEAGADTQGSPARQLFDAATSAVAQVMQNRQRRARG